MRGTEVKASGIFALIAAGVLLFVLGMRFERYRIMREPPRITRSLVERPIFITSKPSTTSPAIVVPIDSARQRLIDSLAVRALHADSTEQAYRASLQIQTTSHPDSIAYADSSGGFQVNLVRHIAYDPIQKQFSDSSEVTSASLTNTRETIERIIAPTLIDRVVDAAPIAGIIILIWLIVGW
jgi:hypothetical protein